MDFYHCEELKRLIAWAETEFNIPCLHDSLEAVPVAELELIAESYVQSSKLILRALSPPL
ncbi:MAG: hypothetical protein Q9179_003426 [Wetmoreana sp. 5 TL-2023]